MNEAERTYAPIYGGSYKPLLALVVVLLLTIVGLMAAGLFQITKWIFF